MRFRFGQVYRPLPAVARGKTGTAMSAGTGVANPAVPETAVVSATGERTGIQAGPAVFPEEAGSAAGAVSGRAGDFVFSG